MLGAKIKELRLKRNWPQKTLAIELGVDRSTVAYWESDRTAPSVEKIKQLALLFDVSADYLLELSQRNRLILYKKPGPPRNYGGRKRITKP